MVLSLGIVCALLVLTLGYYWSRPSGRLPGPARIPIIGNVIPPEVAIWEAFTRYSKEFGPVYSFRILSVDMVVVNTAASIREFLENRSSVFSGRKAPKMAELAGMYEGVLFQPSANRLRQGRRFLATGLQPTALKAYQTVIYSQVVTFLSRLLTSPNNALAIIPTLPTGVALEIAYGYQTKSEDDPFVERAKISVGRFTSAANMSLKDGFIVNWLPVLAYLPSFLPGMSFKRTAAIWERWAWENAAEGFNMVKADVVRRPGAQALEAKEGTYDDVVLMRTASQVYSGGSDTTSSALMTFILAMILHPEVQAKAQVEIDRHMANKGAGRLPSYAADRDDLPYVHAIVREVMRWHGPAPLTSRTSTEDNVYDGYLIKKGTLVMINMWAILHDEDVFPDHEVFRPERWLDGSILSNHDADPLDIAFGFGRRVCPGKYLAADVLFTAMASILAVFNVVKAKDSNGKDIIPKEEYTMRPISTPFPFPCVVTPRSKATTQLVEDAVSAMQ